MTGTYTGLVSNPNFIQSTVGIQAYLVPYVAPTGTTLIQKFQSYLSQIYTSPATQGALVAGAAPCGVFDQSGFQMKAKNNTIEVNPLTGGKYPLAITDCEVTVEGVFLDVDYLHWQTFFGSTAGEIASVAPGVGQLGQTYSGLGNGKVLKQYTLMLRWPSTAVPLGSTTTVPAWDGRVFPKVVIIPDLDCKFDKKDATTCKVTWTAISDLNLLSPDNGLPFSFFDIDCTAAAQ